MPRELVDYRATYERLDKAFPSQFFLSRTQIADFLGVSRNTVNNRFGDKFPARVLLSKEQVARVLSGG